MKKAVIVGAGLMALTTMPAVAADLPVKARPMVPVAASVYNWSGCYVGGFVGGATASRDVTARDLYGYNYGGAIGVGPTFGYKLGSSVIGGGTIGCNYQTGQFVFGVEGEAGYMRLRGSSLDPNSPFLPLDTLSTTQIGSWYGMLTGRAGIAFDRALFYVKGGGAFVKTPVSVVDGNAAGGNTITATNGSSPKATWTAGGGLEYALSDVWSLKGEYMYIAVRGTEIACGSATLGGGNFCWSHALSGVHTAKFGINFHFSPGPVVARY